MATDLGKVGMVMKGDWNSSATYEALDAVTYNNGLYIAKQAVPANTTPTNTTYWQPGVVVTNMFPQRTSVTIAPNSSTTFGVGSSYDVSINGASTYFLLNATNASNLFTIFETRNTVVVNKTDLISPAGFTVVIENNGLKVTNATTYSMNISLYRFI